jgi:hypothetical protein
MSYSSIRTQRGQATSEFIAAMAVLLPLFLGVVYVGKYSDIKHQAIQASRYAAFERALDPTQHENPGVLTEETRKRFFADGSLDNGNVGYQDSTSGLSTATTLNPVWSEVNGTAMVTNYSDVAVSVSKGALSSPAMSSAGALANKMFTLDAGGQVQANVEVNTAAITHFAPLNRVLSIGATTVVVGDAWNADGASGVIDHFRPTAVPAALFKQATTPFNYLFQFFSSSDGPQWGCVNPDSVPADHLSNYDTPAPCKN